MRSFECQLHRSGFSIYVNLKDRDVAPVTSVDELFDEDKPPAVALDRLERNGLVTSRTGDPTPERGGRAKRYFHVTKRGVAAARDTQRALVTMWSDVPQLKAKHP